MTLKASKGLESNNIGSTHNRKYTQFGGSQPWSQQNSSFLSKYDTKESFLHSNVAYKVLNLNFSKKSSTTLWSRPEKYNNLWTCKFIWIIIDNKSLDFENDFLVDCYSHVLWKDRTIRVNGPSIYLKAGKNWDQWPDLTSFVSVHKV